MSTSDPTGAVRKDSTAQLRIDVERQRRALEDLQAVHARELEDHIRRLRKLNQLKDEVLSVCAHDLRSPLQVILGHAQLLADNLVGPTTTAQQKHLEAIARQGRRMASLIEELLQARRAGMDTLEVIPQAADLATVLTDCVQEMAIAAQEKSIRVVARLDELPPVNFDDGKIRQVVVNLLSNAIRYTPSEGVILLEADLRDGEIMVSVSDTGVGLAEEELDAIFEWFRLGRAGEKSREERGCGLGLAICKEIVTRHGGEIWAESVPGRGATFRFTLPGEPIRHPGIEDELSPSGRARLLVCEDDDEFADLIRRILNEHGYEVEIANGGAEALEHCRQNRPDLVLLDVQMPGLDGFTVAQRLQRDARTRDIPIVFLSGCDDAGASVRGLRLGAADFLRKPCEPAEIIARIDRTLAYHEQHRRLRALANEDALTGVANYRHFLVRFHEEIARSQRYGMTMALILVQIHLPPKGRHEADETSDVALRHAGQALLELARETDTVARYGTAEFSVILAHSGAPEAQHFIERVREKLSPTTASFGIAPYDLGSLKTPEDLLSLAEADLLGQPRES